MARFNHKDRQLCSLPLSLAAAPANTGGRYCAASSPNTNAYTYSDRYIYTCPKAYSNTPASSGSTSSALIGLLTRMATEGVSWYRRMKS